MTMDLHNNVRHQHIFNKAMHSLSLALGGILYTEAFVVWEAGLVEIEAVPQKAPLSCSSSPDEMEIYESLAKETILWAVN